jgi:hypothetical protein
MLGGEIGRISDKPAGSIIHEQQVAVVVGDEEVPLAVHRVLVECVAVPAKGSVTEDVPRGIDLGNLVAADEDKIAREGIVDGIRSRVEGDSRTEIDQKAGRSLRGLLDRRRWHPATPVEARTRKAGRSERRQNEKEAARRNISTRFSLSSGQHYGKEDADDLNVRGPASNRSPVLLTLTARG